MHVSTLDEMSHTFYFGSNDVGPNGFGPFEIDPIGHTQTYFFVTSGDQLMQEFQVIIKVNTHIIFTLSTNQFRITQIIKYHPSHPQ